MQVELGCKPFSKETEKLWSLKMNNATNASTASLVIDPAECLQDIYPCSLTWSGNLFLLVVYGAILAWGAKQINLGSDKLLEVFPPGLIGGVLLPVLGALPDATVIFFSVWNASGAEAQDQLNVGMGTLAGSNIILLTMPWAIALLVGRVPLIKTKSGKKKAKYHHPHSKKQREKRKTLIHKAVNDIDGKTNSSSLKQRKKERELSAFRQREALTALFRRIDSNNNGSIEKLEFLKAVTKEEIVDMINEHDVLKPFLKPKSFEESFLSMDTNSDKHITLEEFLKYSDREIYTSSSDADDYSMNKGKIIDDLDDSSSSSSSSSDSASSTSEEDDDDEKQSATALDEIKEMSKRETTMRDISNMLKRKEKNMASSNALPLSSLDTWFNSGITVFVSVKRTSAIMLFTLLPFVVVQLFATLQYAGVTDKVATQTAGLVGFVICLGSFVCYSWDAMHNDKQKKALLRRAQKKREWLSFLDTVKRANNYDGLDTVISSQFYSKNVAKEYVAQIQLLFKESRRQNRLNTARRHRNSINFSRSNISALNLQPKDYALRKLELVDNSRNSQLGKPSLETISEAVPEGEDIVQPRAVAISVTSDSLNEEDGDKRPQSHRVLSPNTDNDHKSSGQFQTERILLRARSSSSSSHSRQRSHSTNSLLSTLSMSVISGVDSRSRLPSRVRANIRNNLSQIREMQQMTKIIKKEMDPKAYEEMRMALMGWAHTKNYMKAVFDAWKAAVESLNDEEQGTDDDNAGQKSSRSIMQKGFGLIFLGTMVIMAFADPLVSTIGRFGKNINVSPFFISMIAVPIASNASEFISSVLFARRKRKKELSLIFSMLYGGVVMNNALCLGVFLLLLFAKGLVWSFGSETLSLLIIAVSIGLYGSVNRTYSSYMAIVIGCLFPLSVLLVVLFRLWLPGF